MKYTIEGCRCGAWWVVPPGRQVPWIHCMTRDAAEALAERYNRGRDGSR